MKHRSSTSAALAGRLALATLCLTALPALDASTAEAGMSCRKVVAASATGEGRNTAEASRVKCAEGEFLTGGTCYPEVRPEPDGSCQTSAMGIIQQIVDHPDTTEQAFFSCLQTGGTDCPVEERTRAMAVCCKFVEDAVASE